MGSVGEKIETGDVEKAGELELDLDPENWDYLTFYVDTANQMTDSDENFKKLCGMFNISVVTGPNWYYIDSSVKPEHYQYADKIYFNLGCCAIGISGGARKSFTIGNLMENKILRPILKDLIKPDPDPDKIPEEISQFIPNDLTVAKLVKEGAKREVIIEVARQNYKIKHCVFVQIDPEFTATVEKAQNKFNLGIFQVYSKFLSGESHYKGTITDGNTDVINPYFNMFIGAQEHYPQILPAFIWSQGFPNRFLCVVDEYGLTNTYKGTRTDRKKFSRGYPAKQIKLLRRWLNEIQNVDGIRVFKAEEGSEAYNLLNAFDDEIFKEQGKPQTHRYLRGYLGRLPDYAKKLACIHNISKKSFETLEMEEKAAKADSSDNYWVTYLTSDDVRWGIKQTRFYFDQFKKLVDLLLDKSYDKAIPTQSASWIKVCKTIQEVGAENKTQIIWLTTKWLISSKEQRS